MARTHQRYSDELLADHLAVGQTVAAAARAAGISERTAYRRKKQPAVRDRIDEVRRAALDTASGRLHQGMVVACDRLIGLVGHANPSVQIRAAQTVIQLALKVRQEVDVADQLDRLEEARPAPGACPDAGAPPAGRDPGQDLTEADRPASPRLSDQPASGGVAGPPVGTAPSDAGIDLAPGGDERGGGVGLDPPPAPEHRREAPELDRRPRPDRTARMMAMVGVLLLLTGLSFAFAGTTRARGEREPAADGALPTCQNLTEPATAGGSPLPRPLTELEHPAARSNSTSWVQAPGGLRTPGRKRLVVPAVPAENGSIATRNGRNGRPDQTSVGQS